jgi:hypothetical protein
MTPFFLIMLFVNVLGYTESNCRMTVSGTFEEYRMAVAYFRALYRHFNHLKANGNYMYQLL